MVKIEKLINIIYHIIGENKFLLDTISSLKDRSYYNLLVNIDYGKGSDGSSDNGNINVGVLDIIESYRLSKELNININEDNYNRIQNNYYLSSDDDYVRNMFSVSIPGANLDLVTKQLEQSDFLRQDIPSKYDRLTYYSLAYSICHEIGHVIHDAYIPRYESFTRERIADMFAFEAIKSICANNDEINDVGLKGAIIGVGQMLISMPPEEDKSDKDHPHSIERLYSLLDFWGVANDSYYWELAYNIVQKWSNKNRIPIDWERENSIKYKDKIIDAYMHFRKNPQ